MKSQFLLLFFIVLFVLSGCSSGDREEISLPKDLNFTGNIISCADFSMHQLLDSENLNISINIGGSGREDLNLTSEYKSFSLPNEDLYCNITLFDAAIGSKFCNDVIMEEPKLISKWKAVSGTLKLSVSNITETEYETFYSLNIILENAVFEKNNSKEQRIIPSLIIENVNLGFLPG